jgi:hypothetical protein
VIVELRVRKREMGIKMSKMRRIRAGMRNQGNNLADRVGNTSYRCNYTQYRDPIPAVSGMVISLAYETL